MNGLQPEDNVALELTFKNLFQKLWPFLRGHRRTIAGCLALVLCYAFVGRLLPILFGLAIDHGIQEHNLHFIWWIAGAYFVVEALRALLAFVQGSYIQRFGNAVLFEIREALIQHVQRLPIPYFDRNPSGRIMTRVTTDVFALGELFSQGFATIFVSVAEMATILFSILLISWKLTAMALLALPALIWVCRKISLRIRFQFGAAKRKLATLNAFTAESAVGMKIVQLFHRQGPARAAFDEISRDYRTHQLRTVGLFAMLWPTLEAFNLFCLCTSLLLGSYFASQLGLSVGQLSAFILLLQSFFKPFKIILERYNQLQNSLASADRVFQILEEPTEPQDGAPATAQKPAPKIPLGSVEFRDVRFRYGDNGPIVLDGISVKIEPGQCVALVGRTGSGKSTMISLVQRMYELKEGEIRLDGRDIRTLSLDVLRSRVGVIQQDGFIFSGSILYNITLEDPRITRERAIWAAEQAQCSELIRRHGGIDAPVLERGANLSVGERQLIAFARVLAFDPEVLILDEATASIDSINEEKIQKTLKTVIKNRTCLVIAHRLSTIVDSDRILLLDKGRLAQSGTHDQLVNRPGLYRDLCLSYFGNRQSAGDAIA